MENDILQTLRTQFPDMSNDDLEKVLKVFKDRLTSSPSRKYEKKVHDVLHIYTCRLCGGVSKFSIRVTVTSKCGTPPQDVNLDENCCSWCVSSLTERYSTADLARMVVNIVKHVSHGDKDLNCLSLTNLTMKGGEELCPLKQFPLVER